MTQDVTAEDMVGRHGYAGAVSMLIARLVGCFLRQHWDQGDKAHGDILRVVSLAYEAGYRAGKEATT